MDENKSIAINLVKNPHRQTPTDDYIFASEQAIEGKTLREINEFLYDRLEKDFEDDLLCFDSELTVYVNTDNVALIRTIVTYIVRHLQSCQLMIYNKQSKQYEPIPFCFDDVMYADWDM